MEIRNPHDRYFKETFAQVDVAQDYLKHYLPKAILRLIDLDTLESHKDSFINKELQEHFSDMLYHVRINQQEGYLYFLP